MKRSYFNCKGLYFTSSDGVTESDIIPSKFDSVVDDFNIRHLHPGNFELFMDLCNWLKLDYLIEFIASIATWVNITVMNYHLL